MARRARCYTAPPMPRNEADTRAKLIDPALRRLGWTERLITREQTPGRIDIVGAGGRRGRRRSTDYLLHARVDGARTLPIAVLEAKAEEYAPDHGLEQAKRDARLHHVPFAFATNGHLFVEHELATGRTTAPAPLDEFPTWDDLLRRYLKQREIDLTRGVAAPLLLPPRDRDRPYQYAAVRAVLERIACGRKRALLSLATGTGKTHIAVSLLRALRDAGQLRRALFVCDRKELRQQALGALHNEFGADAAQATTRNPEKNARVVVATYQTLGIDDEDGDDSYLSRHYTENYFSHIIIDECHRSAWGKWRAVLDRNPDAVHIGLTATPRTYEYSGDPADLDTADDDAITRDNYQYFGEPAYEYSIADAMDDGWLAAMKLVRATIITAGRVEREEDIERGDLHGANVRDRPTGAPARVEDMRERYSAGSLEQSLHIDERLEEMCRDLFRRLLETGDPHQKTLIFCASDAHADRVAAEMGNRYAEWAEANDLRPVDPYAFKCTGESDAAHLSDFKGAATRAFVACTVDLITTGVDVPRLRNVVWFRYLKSPILFHQMLGRGTRIHAESGKLHFTAYDYTNASRLLDASLAQRPEAERERKPDDAEERDPPRIFEAEGVEVRIEPEGAVIMVPEGGTLRRMSLDEYRTGITDRILAEAAGIDAFRERWIAFDERRAMLDGLPQGAASADILRAACGIDEGCDAYDVLASAAFDETPRPRLERADRFEETEERDILRAIARQFGYGGTDALDSRGLFQTPGVRAAGGLDALEPDPTATMLDLKRRVLATDAEWRDA